MNWSILKRIRKSLRGKWRISWREWMMNGKGTSVRCPITCKKCRRFRIKPVWKVCCPNSVIRRQIWFVGSMRAWGILILFMRPLVSKWTVRIIRVPVKDLRTLFIFFTRMYRMNIIIIWVRPIFIWKNLNLPGGMFLRLWKFCSPNQVCPVWTPPKKTCGL